MTNYWSSEIDHLARLGARITRPPKPSQDSAPQQRPTPAAEGANDAMLADAISRLSAVLEGMSKPAAAAPPAKMAGAISMPQPTMAPELVEGPAAVGAGALAESMAHEKAQESVSTFIVRTDRDGALLSVHAGNESYSIQRDDDGLCKGFSMFSDGAKVADYLVIRGAHGIISSVVKAQQKVEA